MFNSSAKTLPFWRKQNIFLQQCSEFAESTGARVLVSVSRVILRILLAVFSLSHWQCVLVLPGEDTQRESVVMDGNGGMSLRVDSNTVVFDTISDTNDVKLRNEMAKHATDSNTSFTVKVQGRINAVINQSSLDSFKDSERVYSNNVRSGNMPSPPKRPRASTYASMFTADAQQQEPAPPVKFTRLSAKPLFLNPTMRFFIARRFQTAPAQIQQQPIARQLMGPADDPLSTKENDKPQDNQLVLRPPSPIFRSRFSSTEIIVAGGCMFPVNDMLDMGTLRSRSHSPEVMAATMALTEI
jgi:hypothetical protein